MILISWSWQSLGGIDKAKKVVYITVGIFIMYIVTLVIFNISKNGIDYKQIANQDAIRNTLVAVFTSINGIIVLPQIAKILEKMNEKEIESKEIRKGLTILLVIFIACVIFECGYIRDIQEGILNVYNSKLGK